MTPAQTDAISMQREIKILETGGLERYFEEGLLAFMLATPVFLDYPKPPERD